MLDVYIQYPDGREELAQDIRYASFLKVGNPEITLVYRQAEELEEE